MSTATPISPLTISIVLDYISPLTGPIPPHLLSRPLLQRHHFLSISPDNVAEYLAWPSPEQSHAVHLLQTGPIPGQDHPYPVVYTADPETLLAHARITPDLRLLFLWDDTQGWQYHNIALMPFPAQSYESFNTAYAKYSEEDFLPEPSYGIEITGDEDDDPYWNSYGGEDDSEHPPAADTDQNNNLNSEDAYWARYSAVQGSADSTIPSPHPEKVVKKSTSGVDAPERIIVPSDDFQSNAEVYNPLAPPEPDALARRLEALASPVEDDAGDCPPLSDASVTSHSTLMTPEPITASLNPVDTLPPPSDALQTADSSDGSLRQGDEFVVIDPSSANASTDPAELALHQSIRGIYQLWKLGRQDKSLGNDHDAFLDSVRKALDSD